MVLDRDETPSKPYLSNRSGPRQLWLSTGGRTGSTSPCPAGEVWKFLDSQRRVYLGFAMENGYPHVTPIWFVLMGERVYMRAQDYKVKVGLAAKGKACVVIDDGDKYRELRGAVMWGRSRLVSEKRLIAKVTALFEAKYSERQWKADEMPKDWVRRGTRRSGPSSSSSPRRSTRGTTARSSGSPRSSSSTPRPRRPRGRSRSAPR